MSNYIMQTGQHAGKALRDLAWNSLLFYAYAFRAGKCSSREPAEVQAHALALVRALPPTLGFGLHKGKRVDMVPENYVSWLVKTWNPRGFDGVLTPNDCHLLDWLHRRKGKRLLPNEREALQMPAERPSGIALGEGFAFLGKRVLAAKARA